jgi:hypothetical protein
MECCGGQRKCAVGGGPRQEERQREEGLGKKSVIARRNEIEKGKVGG